MRLATLVVLGLLLFASPAFAQAQPLSRESVRQFLRDNPDVLMEALREQKIELLNMLMEAQQELAQRREQDAVEQSFRARKAPVITEQTRFRGAPAAKYTLVEYADFQCPYCARGFEVVETLRARYGQDLRVVFKHLPLEIHPEALPAALYMEAIALQSPERAWEFHDTLFQNQDKLGAEFYEAVAKQMGLDMARLAVDLKSDRVRAAVVTDANEARRLGITGTPAFVLNGVLIVGARPAEYFDAIIKRLEATAAPK
jgi:protein-disulfide isomerase